MRFWDASAIVPLLVSEPTTDRAMELLRADNDMLVWTLTPVECFSALYRKEREKRLTVAIINDFRARLGRLEKAWSEIIQLETVKRRAERLLAVHPLQAADSLQLAAALVAFEDSPRAAGLVTFDRLLGEAAAREGFTVLS